MTTAAPPADPSTEDGDPPQEGTPPAADTGGTDGEPFDEARAKAKIKKANAEAKALRERLKAAEAAEAKLAELEDAKLGDVERLEKRAQEATARATDAEARANRLEVAVAKGLTPAQAKRLVGTTVEELEADADELLEAFAAATGDDDGDEDPGTPPPARRPRERLKAGSNPTTDPVETDPAKLANKVSRGF